MNSCDNVLRLARELGLNRSLLYTWRYRLDPANGQAQGEVMIGNSRESKEIDKLKRLLANKTVEADFFRCALQTVGARRRKSGISGEQASTMQSQTSLQGSLSIERMCQLGEVSRAGFYRHLGCGWNSCDFPAFIEKLGTYKKATLRNSGRRFYRVCFVRLAIV
jgi:transposase-like protein